MYKDGHYERLARVKKMVRLGEGVFANGQLKKNAIERAFEVLDEYLDICEELCVEEIRSIGTCALRTADNSKSFVKKIQKKLGFEVEIISGLEEAELILAGIKNDQRAASGTFGFIDIGGGSTEVGIVKNHDVLYIDSLPLGAARLDQMFFSNSEIEQPVKAAREHVLEVLSEHCSSQLPKVTPFLVSSGTCKAVSQLLEKSGKGEVIKLRHLNDLVAKLAPMSNHERAEVRGMNPKRADIIVPGTIILQEVMAYFRASSAYFTKFALRDGLLAAEIETLQKVSQRKHLKRLK
jgi:exopolyphosphatase/guanosine-5'-triphosphate,3'-diphosphate pyrophosphatase